jgi:hypothetical protein
MDTITQLANKFSALVVAEYDPDELEKVNERNQTAEYLDCCATHDFRDANEIMAEAFIGVVGWEPDLIDDADRELWAFAWALARDHFFNQI